MVSLQERDLADYTQRAAASAIRAWVKFCAREELIEAAPKVTMPDVDDELKPPFAADDIRALWTAAKKPIEKVAILFLLDTGLRAFELVALNGGDVDLASGEVQVRSSSVALSEYQMLMAQAAALLPLYGGKVFLLADRGFADTELMRYVQGELHWHWRIRIKSCFKVYRRQHAVCKISRCAPKAGEAYFWQSHPEGSRVPDQRYGPVHLAMAHLRENGERWYVLSDEPTSFADHSLGRFLSVLRLAAARHHPFALSSRFFVTFVNQAGHGAHIVK